MNIGEAELKKLAELAAKRDEQNKKYTSDEEWCGLFSHAKCLFHDCGFPVGITRLGLRVFAVRNHKGGNCETVLARVLSVA